MQMGAERLLLASPSVEQYIHEVKQVVLANERWILPYGKGSLCIRPLLFGSGPVMVFRVKKEAKAKGFSHVLFLDAEEHKYIEEVSSRNVFVLKVKEHRVSVEELLEADEVFCTGTAVGVSTVKNITYQDKRVEFKTGEDTPSRKLFSIIRGIQLGDLEDKNGWTVEID